MCIFISKNVEKLKAEKDVKRLIKLVEKSKDRALSKKAIHALGDLKDPQAVPVLIAILNYDPIQHLGNKSVSMIVDNRVGELLQIKSAINELRTAAAEALGEIGDKRAVFSLRK